MQNISQQTCDNSLRIAFPIYGSRGGAEFTTGSWNDYKHFRIDYSLESYPPKSFVAHKFLDCIMKQQSICIHDLRNDDSIPQKFISILLKHDRVVDSN